MNLCTSTGSRENNQNKVGTYLWDTQYLRIISTDCISQHLDIQLHDHGPGLVSWQGAGGHNVVDEVRDPDDGDREGVVHCLAAVCKSI